MELQLTWLLVAKILALSLAVHISVKIISRRYLSPLSKFPGPWWGCVTSLYSVYVHFTGKQHLVQYELHKKYGPVVRYTPDLLIISNPKLLSTIYHRYADKTSFYAPTLGVRTVFSTENYHDHAIARRRVAGPYSVTTAARFEETIDIWLSRWVNKLHKLFATTRQPMNFADQISWCTYDLMADITFGQPFGFTERDSDVKGIVNGAEYAASLHKVMALLPGVSSWLRETKLGRFLLGSFSSKDFGMGYLMMEARRLAQARIKTTSQVTFLREFLEFKDSEGLSLSEDQVVSESRITMIAGARPVADTITQLLLNVMTLPGCYEKVAAEIESAEASGTLSPIATYKEAQRLPYFSACLRETLRGAPSTISMFPRRVQKGGTEILGHVVPEIAQLSATPWITHRDREVYGDDAELFRPERWLEACPAKLDEWTKYDFQWGYGTRVCLGKHLALMVLYKAPLQFMRNFQVRMQNRLDTDANAFTPTIHDRKGRDLTLVIEPLKVDDSMIDKPPAEKMCNFSPRNPSAAPPSKPDLM